MPSYPDNLAKLGFGEWLIVGVEPTHLAQFSPARVVAVHKDSYAIANGEFEVMAMLVGKLLYTATSPLDFPAVGDWVLAEFHGDDSPATIHELMPRQSLLKRKSPGKKVDFQLLAANVDVAWIVQSLNENFNPRRLERYLVMVNEANIKPVVILSKSDLLESESVNSLTAAIQQITPGVQVIPFSIHRPDDLLALKEQMRVGQTYCLLGSSGVGKSSLINALLGEQILSTQTVSKIASKGRHTTTHRQMIQLDSGALIIDTPGMRELGNFSVAAGLEQTFAEIADLASACRFSDCSHRDEKGCAVRQAVDDGRIDPERYQNYVKMNKESMFHDMSYREKRRKDRDFGKMCKSVLKHKQARR